MADQNMFDTFEEFQEALDREAWEASEKQEELFEKALADEEFQERCSQEWMQDHPFFED